MHSGQITIAVAQVNFSPYQNRTTTEPCNFLNSDLTLPAVDNHNQFTLYIAPGISSNRTRASSQRLASGLSHVAIASTAWGIIGQGANF